MKLQIHHFFDIIRDFGSGQDFEPHKYGHSYHKIALLIQQNQDIEIEIVTGSDDICMGCSYLENSHCIDKINHRKDFHSKEKFNDHINSRIMEICEIKAGDRFSPLELCNKAGSYIDHIGWVYEGNDHEHTQKRKTDVIAGLIKYTSYC